MKCGFDNEKYLKVQYEKILKVIDMFDSRLYLEFGGKLFDDYHASRVLPGFKENSKINILKSLKKDMEVIFCINADDIKKNKVREDYGITYDMELLRLIDALQKLDIEINSVVITMYNGQSCISGLEKSLQKKGIKTYIHKLTNGYPTDVELIVSEDGYGKNPYIETTKKLVVVTAPGPNSGKLATCLSQMYHEYKMEKKAGYAKFETFPVWDLSLKHPLNISYEAATADLGDINMIDPFHLEAYGQQAVNYNRDIETFPILRNILNKISGEDIYKSPTDMGVNVVKQCIIDDDVVRAASCQEIIRRYYIAMCDNREEKLPESVVRRIKILMNELGLSYKDRPVIQAALKKSKKENVSVIALELPSGKIITGKQTKLLSPASSLIINVIKELANIPDELYLLSPSILEPIIKLKKSVLTNDTYLLNLQEVLIALSICSATNSEVSRAIDKLESLCGCEAHSTYILKSNEKDILKKLKINLTSEPNFGLAL
ncbi:MAG: DUF1846 domain-containing protein [Clostridia bacterium]